MSFYNIPAEMRERPQWVLWRLEWRSDDPNHEKKPTKVPYSPWPVQPPLSGKASATKPVTWGTFEAAIAAPLTCLEPAEHDAHVSVTGYSGIGYMFSNDDEFTGIDLDDTHGDAEAFNRQVKIFREFDSYSELSPSGTGIHIIVKGKVPGGGRRRAAIEIYSTERFFTMTGNVQNPSPIAERQELINLLYSQMGPAPVEYEYAEDGVQNKTDEEILKIAREASNGAKFSALYDGDWSSLYNGDQSRADFALVDMLGFYSRNKAQVTRLFLASQLGQRDKAQKRPRYVSYMVERSFDNQLPPIDMEGFKVKFQEELAEAMAAGQVGAATGEPGSTTVAAPDDLPAGLTSPSAVAPVSHGPSLPSRPSMFPPGLVGDVAEFILSVSPRPVPEISLAAAISLISAVAGRAYNVSGTGLNQYVLMLAMTGAGKDAVSVGISKLMGALKQTVPASADFIGPGELVSSAGLIKWMAQRPAIISTIGEFGAKMQEMASPHANSHIKGLERTLLQLYSKSGAGNVFDPMAYSDREKNTAPLQSPSLTILGESVPERFYEMLDESMIASGLLPRFLVFEYKGKRKYLRKGTELVQPSFALVEGMASLVAHALTLSHQGTVCNVPMTAEAQAKFDEFDRWTTDQINKEGSEVKAQLWNRAHLKAMKLAATVAVGINFHSPIITINECLWATNMIVEQTLRMVSKFETGEVGSATSNEVRQRKEIYKAIGKYMSLPFDEVKKYGGSFDEHRDGVIRESHIQRRVISSSAFKNDKFGASNALKRAIAYMMTADELREMNPNQTFEKYGSKAKSYVVANPEQFVEAIREKIVDS